MLIPSHEIKEKNNKKPQKKYFKKIWLLFL